MRYAQDLLFEVKIFDDGAILGRRKDRKPMTAADVKAAQQLADTQPGITAADVLRVFPGAKVKTQKKDAA